VLIEPLHGMGFFLVRESGLIEQLILFEYYDPGEEYREITSSEELLEREKKNLSKNMQYFLDREEVYINGKRVFPRVIGVDIGFRESYKYPYVLFFIVFLGELKKGLNTYEDRYEPETAEYPYSVYWVFPLKARVVKADLGVPYSLLGEGRILLFSVPKNTRIGGYERIEFELY